LFVGFVVYKLCHIYYGFSKYVPRNFDCYLVLKKPGTVTIASVAAAPVPIAVEIVDKERSLVLLLFSC
jgi:hypothetical protein